MAASGVVFEWQQDALQDWLSGKTLKALICNNTDAAALATVEFVDDISANEIAGGGYARQTLANVTVNVNTQSHIAWIDADDITWSSLDQTGVTFGSVYIFADTGNDATAQLIARLDIDGDTSTGTDYTVELSSTGGFLTFDTP